jgi:CubicO group peptidase (beta-lactamase class C family)
MARRLLVLALVVLAGCGGSSSQQHAATGPSLAQRLDAELAKRGKEAGVPGVAGAVVVAGRPVWSGAWGMADLEHGPPMTPETPMAFASISKTLVASLVLRLAEQRRLSLDDPIRRWVPAWRGAPDMPIRRLLNQTSGVSDPGPAFYRAAERVPSRRVEPEAWLAAMPRPDRKPSATPVYANANYILVGMVARRAAGREWERMLGALPPGLVLQPGQTVGAGAARGYFYPEGDARRQPWPTGGGGLIPSTAVATLAGTSGGLAGSTAALAGWGDALLGGHILRPASLREMTTFHDGGMWQGYGLGLGHQSVDGREVWGHGGDIPGFHAELWHLPKEDLTLALAWNDDRVDDDVIPRSMLIVALDAVRRG